MPIPSRAILCIALAAVATLAVAWSGAATFSSDDASWGRCDDALVADNALYRRTLDERRRVMFDEAGWPFRAFASEHRVTRVAGGALQLVESSAAMRVSARTPVTSPPRFPAATYSVALPLRPLIVGLTLDVAIYCALMRAAFVWCRRSVAWARGRKGLCVRCAYPIGPGSRCPECGTLAEPVSN